MPRALDETWQMLDDFAEVARLSQLQDDHRDALAAMCELAMKLVEGDHASIATINRGEFSTVVATSDLPSLVDQIQAEEGEGPWLDTPSQASDGVRIGDLSTDSRWPTFGQRTASSLGLHSMVAAVRPTEDNMVAAINVYATRPDAFTAENETLLSIFATTAAGTLLIAHHDDRAQQLERALHTSRRIGVALGILMTSRRVSLDEAWNLLSKTSQNNNLKLSVLAEHVLQTGSLDIPEGD